MAAVVWHKQMYASLYNAKLMLSIALAHQQLSVSYVVIVMWEVDKMISQLVLAVDCLYIQTLAGGELSVKHI